MDSDSDDIPEFKIPRSAKDKFVPLKYLGSGKEGHVVLAAPRSDPQGLASCVALKILSGDKVTSVARKLLKKLKKMEGDESHLIAAVRDYPGIPTPNWHALEYIPGRSIEYLLRKHATYKEHGLPPCVIFHVFAQLVRVQKHLKDNEYCHIDLKEGGNVMLSNKDGNLFPTVTLIDLGGIKPYDQGKELEHTLYLARKMTKGSAEIAEHWRPMRFRKGHRKQAKDKYKMIHDRAASKVKETDTLEALWKQCGESFERLVESLTDEKALKELQEALDDAKITEEEVKEKLQGKEWELEVDVWDVGIATESYLDKLETSSEDGASYSAKII